MPLFNHAPAASIRQDLAKTVADIVALRAVTITERFDNQVVYVADKDTMYELEPTSGGVDDGDLIIKPTDEVGAARWEKRFTIAAAPATHKDSHVSGADAFVAADTLESASRTVRTPLRNETGSTIVKGTLVTVTGFSVPEGRPTVAIADKDDSNARPAVAVTEAAVGNNTNFEGLVLGLMTGLNTAAFSANDQLVLGDAGTVSRPPPDVDPFTGEIQLIGSVIRSDASNGSIYFTLSSGLLPMTAAQFFATKEISPTGGVSGGEVTRVSGLNVAVAAGSGFVNNGTDIFRVTWSAVPSLALTASDTNFIFVDKNGVVQDSVSPPDLENNISLADAITDGSTVLLLANHQVLLTEHLAKTHIYRSEVIGNVAVSGLVTSQATAALRVKVDLGTFYTRDFRVSVIATDPVTFTYWFRDGSGGFTRVAGSTLIDKDNFDDGSGILAALLTTEFKKDLLFVVFTASGLVEYHVFYGQEKFASQALAEGGNLPAADSDVIANGIRSAGIVQEGAAATIASFVDVRPFLGQLAPPVTSVSDHGLLSGLSDDDHTQYLLASGARAMLGNLNMGVKDIVNASGIRPDLNGIRESGSGSKAWATVHARAIKPDTLIDLVLRNEGGNAAVSVRQLAFGVVFNQSGLDMNHRFEGNTDPDLITLDAGLDRVGVGVALGAHLAKFHVDGPILGQRDVEAVASTPHTIIAAESLRFFTNEGASAQILHNLPPAAKDLTYTFYVQNANGMKITAASADTIRISNQVSIAAGFVESLIVGACVRLVAINATEWVAEQIVDVWDVETS